MTSNKHFLLLTMMAGALAWSSWLLGANEPPKFAVAVAAAAAATPAQIEFFEKQIRPLLIENCYKCHSVASQKVKGNLLLDSREAALKGGDSGPAIVPGNVEKSRLIAAVRYTDDDMQMPPKHRLSGEQVAALEQWVKMGAPFPSGAAVASGKPAGPSFNVEEARKFWSYQPVKDAAPPSPADKAWPANPIDQFIRARQEQVGVKPVPQADRRTLIRRVTYDLTGLPPTPDDVDAFVNDTSPSAWEKVVDRLLASQAYGEKWGRHWLDLVRYADTSGCNADFPVPSACKYRNWVIDAFNADMPYDQFVQQQIAGDLLPAANEAQRERQIIATGYLANARRFGSRNAEFHLTIDDLIDNMGKSMLGLSLGCARCHDHKFDPVAMSDYYGLYGIFASTKFAFPGTEIYPHPKDFIPLGPPELAEEYRQREAELSAIDDSYERLVQERRPLEIAEREAAKAIAEGKPIPWLRPDAGFVSQVALTTVPAGAARVVATFPLTHTLALAAGAPKPRALAEVKAEMNDLREKQRQLEFKPIAIEKAYAVCDATKPANARIMRKGDPRNLAEEAPRGFLLVLGGQKLPAEEKGSGRRELADWIADAHNPLTVRVMANRIWQWHFGRGIVQTPNDFGARGKPPTHPELLDYLASRFVESGWSVKKLSKMILMSRTYQLASDDEDEPHLATNLAADTNNDYLWHFNRRRLEAEEVRDSMLAISGILDVGEPATPHPFPPENEWHYTQHKPFVANYDSKRRTIYLMQQRIKKQPFLEVFDGADTNAITSSRARECSPVQALFFMNDPLSYEAADQFAVRVGLAHDQEDKRIDYAYRLCLGRPASSEEIEMGHEYLADVRERLKAASVPWDQQPRGAMGSYLRVLLSSNEFFYLD
jgi:hypothetical protein